MSFAFAPSAMAETLEAKGYDATGTDTVVARKEAQVVYEVVVDQGGQVKFTATRSAAAPDERQVTRQGRSYRILREQEERLTIVTSLDHTADLAAVMDDLEAMVAVQSTTTARRSKKGS